MQVANSFKDRNSADVRLADTLHFILARLVRPPRARCGGQYAGDRRRLDCADPGDGRRRDRHGAQLSCGKPAAAGVRCRGARRAQEARFCCGGYRPGAQRRVRSRRTVLQYQLPCRRIWHREPPVYDGAGKRLFDQRDRHRRCPDHDHGHLRLYQCSRCSRMSGPAQFFQYRRDDGARSIPPDRWRRPTLAMRCPKLPR